MEKQIKCICELLRKDKGERVELDYDCYTSLVMEFGRIWAYGEGGASADINYCPFCGKKFE